MHVGWLKLDGAWYYLEASGAAARGLRTVGGVEYRFDAKGLWVDDPDLPEALKPALTGIMGTVEVKPADLAALYEAKAKASGGKIVYPAEALGRGGAPDIAAFCAIVTEEAAAEGVRADVVFAQMMVETGWLRFGGDVKVEQFNFAGLGATGGGVPGNSFPDVRTGVRAQVQHLKAYACAQPLKQDCVDERFKYVTRGCAPYVEWLGIPDNPEGKGWAADAGYGKKLLAVMAEIG
ncbi:MAG: mannosyl-glycoprotein endo-beta-N-acetylglucosaminidase [Eggerthellaceae bacterium]|nr:mannosyl-glycoprotein endo-beta-N-acetylglucosaminidase [Eggerthellaceae bacterium]